MATFPTVIEDLPEEVLLVIFSKLTLPERKIVRRVCKQWLDICNSANITQRELIKLNVNNLHLFKIRRGCLNLEIDNQGSISANLKAQIEFWAAHGDTVRSLNVKIFDHHLAMIYKIINHCFNVRDLVLEFTGGSSSYKCNDDNVMVDCDKLNGLVSLTLTGRIPLVFLKDAAFLRLVGSVPNLKRLVLNFLDEQQNFYEVPIMPLIVKQVFTLTELVLYGCVFATDSFLDNLFGLLGHQITGLYINKLRLDSIDCLTKHAKKLPNLTNLELKSIEWSKGKSDSLSELVAFKKLEFISLFYTKFDEGDVIPLIKLENLKGLSIGCFLASSTAYGIWDYFGMKNFPNLVALQVRCEPGFTDDVLKSILPHLPNFKCLDVNYCSISSVVVEAISANCKQLTHLSLGAFPVNTALKPSSLNTLVALVYLDLFYRFDPKNVTELCFPKLETIKLCKVSPTDEELKVLFTNCPRLKRIDLNSTIVERVSNLEIVRNKFSYPCRPNELFIFDFIK